MKFTVWLLAKRGLITDMSRVLCVAEKNDAAKNIAALLSRNQAQRTEGHSKFNKIYRFNGQFRGQNAQFAMTSVSGHLMSMDFVGPYREWKRESISTLFEAPIYRSISNNMQLIGTTLKEQARCSQVLIIWTDCDREGENIGAEIVAVCTEQNPHLDVYRARFSEITLPAVTRALQNVVRLDQNMVSAVDCRSELDLRIGAAFTRLQTLHLQATVPALIANTVVSYGSCQFPTLGFIVERYKSIKEFIAESFWRLVGHHKRNNQNVEFVWLRNRLFDQNVVTMFLDECNEAGFAQVISVRKTPKSRWRPVALDTVEFEKLAVRKLRMSAKEAMASAERLYSQGYISYPRTETNIFPKELELRPLVEFQQANDEWGGFAAAILNNGYGPNPRNGRKTDEAHPPIHPLKAATRADIPRDWAVYELIVRHFLACVSRDATGQETTVEVNVADEIFKATGLIIDDKGYLEVYYKYDNWSTKVIPAYQQGEVLKDLKVTMNEGRTTPPQLLTEADLIGLMEKYGIGTDATHAEHIEKIKERQYVTLNKDQRFLPGYLGLALVESYNEMGFEMSKPGLRSNLESQLLEICNGTKTKEEVLREQLRCYKSIFQRAEDRIVILSDIFQRYLRERTQAPTNTQQSQQQNRPPPPTPPAAPAAAPRPQSRPQARSRQQPRFSFPGQVNQTAPPQEAPSRQQHQFHFPTTAPPRPNLNSSRPSANGRGNAPIVNVPPPPRQNFYPTQNNGIQFQPTRNINQQNNVPNCNCGIPSITLTSRTAANPGRQFLTCSKQSGDPTKCKFWQWAT